MRVVRTILPGLVVTAVGVIVLLVLVIVTSSSSSSSPVRTTESALRTNPNLDPGTALDRPAPNFTLTDQFGHSVSLRSYRGRVVIVAFNDSECTTVCPLTTTAMVDAKRFLGADGPRVTLLGIDANPDATAVHDVRAYSQVHGMLHQWRFLTGSRAQLERVWHAYDIEVAIQAGQIDHTPALFEIDPEGRLRELYMTQMNYSSVPQLGRLLAVEASSLLPDHPAVHTSLSYAEVPPIGPTVHATLARSGGGTVALGPGAGAHLYLFFATWDSEDFPDLGRQLDQLDRYASAGGRLPALTAVDEGSVEPSPASLPRFVRGLAQPLRYPLAIDSTGRIADGYEVQDEPWYVLVSPTGRILWFQDVATTGWPSVPELEARMRAALARTTSPAAAPAAARDVPAPLAAVQAQAGQLVSDGSSLAGQLRALRGYPVVVNIWASWCPNCVAEFGLFRRAAQRYGHQVGFLGADYQDSTSAAQAFLAKHRVGYPSYTASTGQLAPLTEITDLPTTVYIDRAGRVIYRHIGPYLTQGTLDQDIQTQMLDR